MTNWVKETVDYFLNKGNVDMYNTDEKLFGTIDMRRAKYGDEELISQDDTIIIPFGRCMSNNDNYKVYMGVRHVYLGMDIFNMVCVILYDIITESYVLTGAWANRIARRFIYSMHNGIRVLVFEDLYNHYYMSNVNFCDEEF